MRSPLCETRAGLPSRSAWTKAGRTIQCGGSEIPFILRRKSVKGISKTTPEYNLASVLRSRSSLTRVPQNKANPGSGHQSPRYYSTNRCRHRGRNDDAYERAGRLVQRRVHAGARGAHPVPRFELGLRRRLLRHDPHFRASAVQGEGARRAALPLAQISAHRPRLRPAEDVRADRGAVRAQPPSARAGRRLLGRPAHQPRRQGGRRATTSTITARTSCSNARRCRSCSAPSCSRTASASSSPRTAACRRIRSRRAPRRTTT